MARPELNHDDRYQVLEPLEPLGRVNRWLAAGPGGSRGFLHRVALDEPGLDRDHLEPQFQRWAAIRSPHAPMLADAWFMDDEAAFFTLGAETKPLDETASIRLLDGGLVGFAREAARQSLAAVGTLHEHNISHRALELECFGVAPGGVVFLTDWGLAARIERLVLQASETGTALQLTTSYMARDVADWAAAMARLLVGRELLAATERRAEEPDDARVARAASQIEDSIKDKPLAKLLADGLRAHAGPPKYESALDALDAFPPGPPEP